jgi:hypothetical protein
MSIEDPCAKLLRHHQATIGLFVAFWIYTIAMILIIEFADIPERWERNMIGTAFAAAIVAILLQFSVRCPRCRANLGWQRRLGIPKTCAKCGERLRD